MSESMERSGVTAVFRAIEEGALDGVVWPIRYLSLALEAARNIPDRIAALLPPSL